MLTSNPETQIEVERLVSILRDLGPGELATYEELSGAVGYSVQDRPFPLIRARRIVEKETGLRLETVVREGVKKLSADALPGIGAAARKRIGRHARRQGARLTGLRYNDIDGPLQARLDAERSLLAAVNTVAKADAEEIEKHTSTGPMVAMEVFNSLRRTA